MINEPLTEAERQMLKQAVLRAIPAEPGQAARAWATLLSKISGTDTTLIAQRAYPASDYSGEGGGGAVGARLSDAQLVDLRTGHCPDCRQVPLVTGPRGGMSQNVACLSCGAEFNETRVSGLVLMAHRNSAVGIPDRFRLRDVFGIELAAVDAYSDDTMPERACDRCKRLYRGPAVYCSLKCAVEDAT